MFVLSAVGHIFSAWIAVEPGQKKGASK